MQPVWKWLLRILAGLAALLVLVVIGVYIGSELLLRRAYDAPMGDIAVPDDPASIAEGRRLATVMGCYRGCHAHLEGEVFFEDPLMGRLSAPNLTLAAARDSDAELARKIRHGIRTDGTSLVGMPSTMFQHLSDEDVGKVIAFIRSEPRVDEEPPPSRLFLARVFILLEPDSILAARTIDHWASPKPKPTVAATAEFGWYVGMTACPECHGPDLHGMEDFSPDLVAAKAYTLQQFRRLMREGIPVDERDLELMDDVARIRFDALTDLEIEALYLYLQTL